MCGLVGYLDLSSSSAASRELIGRMADALVHRGPDSYGDFVSGPIGMGFRRLAIVDLQTGDQPLYNEDGSIVVCCNGEIFNHEDLRNRLKNRGHHFRTRSDIEVLPHLYEEYGLDLFDHLNGQFSAAIYDQEKNLLLLARDPSGITPLFYAVVDNTLVFASEIKALLEYPGLSRTIDVQGLDQVISFPGLVSPQTMFQEIRSLENGHCLIVSSGRIKDHEFWDLEYPIAKDTDSITSPMDHEAVFVQGLRERLEDAVAMRLKADVPVGVYLSGGLDSSLIAALAKPYVGDGQLRAFSIDFEAQAYSEARHQQHVANHLGVELTTIRFSWVDILSRLRATVYHSECPVKETYNTCAHALSEHAHANGFKVVLAGEGADELFAGYPGYRFDASGFPRRPSDDEGLEARIREKLWGDPSVFYEKRHVPLQAFKHRLYSPGVREALGTIGFPPGPLVNPERLRKRDRIQQRSYIDYKIRLVDHLLGDHGDRMLMANSVEGRFPFLDREVVDFAIRTPTELKIHNLDEKYIVKCVARDLLPESIIRREKFGFRAPGSPYLFRQDLEWVRDVTSYELIKRQGFFDPAVVQDLVAANSDPHTDLHPHLDDDFLLIVLTFGILLDQFDCSTF